MRMLNAIFGLLLLWSCTANPFGQRIETQVLVIGGGTGGTAAGITAARLGAQTLLIEEGPWLGGMISAAGVTCTDGNHNMPSGIWNEFRERIYSRYEGPQAVATGWVSNTQFEPRVSDSIWKSMAIAEKNLKVLQGWSFVKILHSRGRITGAVFTNSRGESLQVKATVCIDATELGDVMANADVPFDLGMEAGDKSGEDVGVTQTNDIVQDLTWVAILKDYGQDADCTLTKPAGYNPMEFDAVCKEYYHNKNLKAPNVDARKMLDYGKLPNGKYMINWPNSGNDTYLNVINLSSSERKKELEKAKQTTLRFVYFIQQELGFKNLGLADDEFPTDDRLALMPYHREGRRLQGMVRMNVRHIADPFGQPQALYRTGISVGDYPIDHHHKKNPAAPQHLDFYPVPSYNIPLGSLIPRKQSGLIVAEKGISVSNVANGTTRLQPVVMLTGQAAGTLAALCVQQHKIPRDVSVRAVQAALLKQKAYIMPYFDIKPNDPHFDAIQRIGATGIIKGRGEPFQWANRTWFCPDSTVNTASLQSLKGDFIQKDLTYSGDVVTLGEAISFCSAVAEVYGKNKGSTNAELLKNDASKKWVSWGLKDFDTSRNISRRELAVLLDKLIDPFHRLPVNHEGNIQKP